MRIGINTLFLIPGEVGGSQTYFCETLKAMIAQFPEDEYVLFTQRENDAFLKSLYGETGCVRYVKLDFAARNRYMRIIREQTELPWRVRRSVLDVLWSPGYTAPIGCRTPQVVSILDMQYKRFPEDLSWLGRLATDVLVKQAARVAKRIIAISNFSADEVALFTSASREKIDVTPLAVDPVYAEPVDRLADYQTPYILCVANTYPHKNVETLVKAYGEIQSELPHDLVLVGKPRRGESAVVAAIDELPEPDRVKRLQGVSRRDLVALYQHCDVFVFPSMYEGFGLPILEALMAGVPVVAADIPTTHEFGGEGVKVFEANDVQGLIRCIRDDLSNPVAAEQRMGGQEHARGYTWRSTADKTHRLIGAVVGVV